MERLTSPDGELVHAHDLAVEHLKAAGFTPAKDKTAKPAKDKTPDDSAQG